MAFYMLMQSCVNYPLWIQDHAQKLTGGQERSPLKCITKE